jgi:hypothetical protein
MEKKNMKPLQSKIGFSLFFGKQAYNQGQLLYSSNSLSIFLGLTVTHGLVYFTRSGFHVTNSYLFG